MQLGSKVLNVINKLITGENSKNIAEEIRN
jgi:hypothetical protein